MKTANKKIPEVIQRHFSRLTIRWSICPNLSDMCLLFSDISLAEFERDLLRERVRSGVAAAKARGQKFGRQPGQRIKADKLGPKVLQMVGDGYSYRKIAEKLNLSKTTVNDIVKRHRQSEQKSELEK